MPRTMLAFPNRCRALCVLLALAACGCGERTVVVTSHLLQLRLDEYRITPQLVQVPAGTLQIVAYDTGILPHDVRIEASNPDRSGNVIVLGGTPAAHPGEKVTATITLTPGRYQMVDTIANHGTLGDYGTLIVK